MIACEVFLNGVKSGKMKGDTIRFSFDVTDALNETGEKPTDGAAGFDGAQGIPPYGFVVDYLTFGGFTAMSSCDMSSRYISKTFLCGGSS